MVNNSLDLIKSLDFGRYKIKKLLGKGAFGEVYLCFDRELERNVAVKMFHTTTDTNIHDLARESILLAKVEHANIVPVYDVVKDTDSVMMVMRYINGLHLQSAIKQYKTPLHINDAYLIFRKILLALDFSHSRGIIHLDLKPENILLSMADEVLVSDFGISQYLKGAQDVKPYKLGTPLYMSPEQISGSFMDARSDIYALGFLYYTMLTGNHPFNYCKSIDHLIESHNESMPVRPSSCEKSIPPALDDIVFKAIQKNPSDRYRNCLEFILALDDALGFQMLSESRNNDFRYFVRIDTELPVICFSNVNKEKVEGEMINISVGGCCIEFKGRLNIAGEIEINFHISHYNNKTNFCVKAILVDYHAYKQKWTQVSVQFTNLSDEEKNIIATYVRNSLLDAGIDDETSDEEVSGASDTSETVQFFN